MSQWRSCVLPCNSSRSGRLRKGLSFVSNGVLLFALTLLLSTGAKSQFTFTGLPPVTTGLPKVVESQVAWGDYDGDGYLDLAIEGSLDSANAAPRDLSKNVTKIYHNNHNNTFTAISAPLVQVFGGDVAWGDYDNDGKLDLLVMGVDVSNNRVLKLYHNDGGGVFSENTTTTFPGVVFGKLAWGDYNNDGYLDFVVCGFAGTGNPPITKLFRNNGGGANTGFTEVTSAVFTPVNGHSKITWGDFNNDGYLDIAYCGRTNYNEATQFITPNPVTKVYYNSAGSGTFVEDTSAHLLGVWYGGIAAADFNNDGKMDIIVEGLTTGTDVPNVRDTTILYKNNGDGTFTPLPGAGFPNAHAGTIAWGDLDADGLLDVLIKGYGSDSGVFHNDGTETFSLVAWPPAPPEGAFGGGGVG